MRERSERVSADRLWRAPLAAAAGMGPGACLFDGLLRRDRQLPWVLGDFVRVMCRQRVRSVCLRRSFMAGRNLPAGVALLRKRFSAEELARVYRLRRTWLGGAIHAGREQPMNRGALTLAITMALTAGCGSDLRGVFVMPTQHGDTEIVHAALQHRAASLLQQRLLSLQRSRCSLQRPRHELALVCVLELGRPTGRRPGLLSDGHAGRPRRSRPQPLVPEGVADHGPLWGPHAREPDDPVDEWDLRVLGHTVAR